MIPHALLTAGDVHGDPQHLAYLFQVAFDTQCDAIFQVGDFGYWEHEQGGAEFLDVAAEGVRLTEEQGFKVEVYWLDGNHENHPLLWQRYGPGGPKHKPTPEGFWEIRTGVYYVPRGLRWVWRGYHMMALGGAHSWDKGARLKKQREDGHARWFPTEEITDDNLATALADPTPLDVLFTHDKPRDAKSPKDNSGRNPLALPNQDKIQKVVDRLHPKIVIHGHLHCRYTTKVDLTVIEGLDCNPQFNKKGEMTNHPEDSWLRVSLI
jgi:hypothetical protein